MTDVVGVTNNRRGLWLNWLPLTAFILSGVILFARRPDILLNAQFWAEDGTTWFRPAYMSGPLQVLFRPHTGYLQTFSRIVFGIGTLFPLAVVPILANAVGLAVRAALPALLLTKRFNWIDWRVRLIMLFYYLLMPGLTEVHANITNSHWYLGLYLAMLMVATPPKSLAAKSHDLLAILICGLSGPFSVFIAPLRLLQLFAVVRFDPAKWRRLDPFTIGATALLMLVAAVQLTLIGLYAGAQRPDTTLGAEVLTLLQIIDVRVFLGTFWWIATSKAELDREILLVIVIAIAALALLSAGFWRADGRVRLLIAFTALSLLASMISPVLSRDQPQWPLFLIGGDRYFVLPRLGFFIALVALFAALLPKRWYNASTMAAILLLAVPLVPKFRIPAVTDYGFRAAAVAFDQAPKGTEMDIQITPKAWVIKLTKR